MNEHNSASVIDVMSLSNEERILKAHEFSEGSEALEKLLLKCWNNNIMTIGCCVGHEEKDNSYIAFRLNRSSINNSTYSFFNELTNFVDELNSNEISVDFNGSLPDNFDVVINVSQNIRENVYSILSDLVGKESIVNNDKLKIALDFTKIMNHFKLVSRIAYDDSRVCVGMVPDGYTPLFGDNLPYFADNLECMKSTGQFSSGNYEASWELLKEWLSIFYGEEYDNKKER